MDIPGTLKLIDKPKGITSFDVIRVLRRQLGIRKMGHAGTLDPLATGLLIIGIGEGTKELHKLIGLPKAYDAEVLLGTKTDTGDTDGKVIETKEVPDLNEEKITAALISMLGDIHLQVPAYSAVKREGQPLYAYARAGKQIEIPTKVMHVKSARLLNYKDNVISIAFEVTSGTYIRSLAEELGRRLGTVATIQNLRRTSIGAFRIDQAERLEE